MKTKTRVVSFAVRNKRLQAQNEEEKKIKTFQGGQFAIK